jgi:exopolyphosphatase/guanosine-5'-triphosphate,3'-diphosphate pyrophosphatase
MRLGVLDVGSNTVHLLVVDAHPGAHPTPMHDHRAVLRLAEHVDDDDLLSKAGEKALLRAVQEACDQAEAQGCDELLALVTSAIREATNGLEVLERIRQRTGVELQVLSGEEEARLTFLAVRRWFGWSAGQLLVLDIGGGSLELASGIDEFPDVALSLPLGAGRMTRRFLPAAQRGGRPDLAALAELDAHATTLLEPAAAELADAGPPDLVAATSKTFRTLARLAGAAPSSAGLRASRKLSGTGLGQLVEFVSRIESAALAELPGVSANRAHQVPAGAVVAAATMRALDVRFVRICPWALREGVILRRLDSLGGV